jgi:hypothetical protein
MPMSDIHITISVIGLNNTDYSVLRVAMSLWEKHADIKVSILDKNDTSGAIIITDYDTEKGKSFYQRFNNAVGRAMLLLTSETLNEQRNFVLKKPVRVQTLKDVLSDIYAFLKPAKNSANSAVQTPTTSAANLTQPPVTATSNHPPLFFVLFKASQEQQVIQIFCPPNALLFVDGINRLVACSLSQQSLRKMILNPTCSFKMTKLSPANFEMLAKGQLIMPLSHLLWIAGLYGSYGQLLPDHSAEIPVQLKAWPNFSRLEYEPAHMQLAALMTTRALTLKQIEQKTQFPWETIVSFYNAAYSTELVIVNPANLPIATAHKPSSTKLSLFAKIANRLKI